MAGGKAVKDSGKARTKVVSRLHLKSRTSGHGREGATAAVHSAVALEYLTADELESAGDASKDFKVKCITLRHLHLVICRDEELDSLIKATTTGSGVIPHIRKSLGRKHNSRLCKGCRDFWLSRD